MDDDEILEVLRRTAAAIRASLESFEGHGPSGERAGQYALDLVADAAATEVLVEAGLSIFSEESGRSGSGEVVVVVDPVDGSTNADRGIPFYCVSLCALDSEGPLAGLVENLPVGTRYEAVRGRGATKDGREIRVGVQETTTGSVVGVNGVLTERFDWAQTRTMGAAALESCLVAEGALDAYVQVGGAAISPWDYLAGMLIVIEAGGAWRSLDGQELVVVDAVPRRPLFAATERLADGLAAQLTA